MSWRNYCDCIFSLFKEMGSSSNISHVTDGKVDVVLQYFLSTFTSMAEEMAFFILPPRLQNAFLAFTSKTAKCSFLNFHLQDCSFSTLTSKIAAAAYFSTTSSIFLVFSPDRREWGKWSGWKIKVIAGSSLS